MATQDERVEVKDMEEGEVEAILHQEGREAVVEAERVEDALNGRPKTGARF